MSVVEHAGVTEVWTSFVVENGGYELRISDEGTGFAPPERLETLALSGHFGLVTMQERMAAVRGHLDVHSTPGEGTGYGPGARWTTQDRRKTPAWKRRCRHDRARPVG